MNTDGQQYLRCDDCGEYVNSTEAEAHQCSNASSTVAGKRIIVRRLDMEFMSDQVTSGTPELQADQAVHLISDLLEQHPLRGNLIAYDDEIEVEIDEE